MPDTFLNAMAAVDTQILNALGETVSIKNEVDVVVGAVAGIFERQYVETLDLQGYMPTFTYKESDLTIEEDYKITHNAQEFNVRVKQPDGTGVVFLILGKI
jgi:hypothetical protein